MLVLKGSDLLDLQFWSRRQFEGACYGPSPHSGVVAASQFLGKRGKSERNGHGREMSEQGARDVARLAAFRIRLGPLSWQQKRVLWLTFCDDNLVGLDAVKGTPGAPGYEKRKPCQRCRPCRSGRIAQCKAPQITQVATIPSTPGHLGYGVQFQRAVLASMTAETEYNRVHMHPLYRDREGRSKETWKPDLHLWLLKIATEGKAVLVSRIAAGAQRELQEALTALGAPIRQIGTRGRASIRQIAQATGLTHRTVSARLETLGLRKKGASRRGDGAGIAMTALWRAWPEAAQAFEAAVESRAVENVRAA